MARRTLTAANSTLYLGVSDLFNVPQKIEGYATDDAFASEAVDVAETTMGVDGKMSAGFVPVIKPMTINIQADSLSNDFFDALLAAMEASREVYWLNGTLAHPALGKSYILVNGILQNASAFAAARKTLQPRPFRLMWESITAVPL